MKAICIDCGKECKMKNSKRCKDCNIARAKYYWKRGLSY